MTALRSIAFATTLATTLACGACNIVSGLTDFSVTVDGGVDAAGGAGSCVGCGEHVWSDSYSSESNSRGRCVAADKSGNVIVAGSAAAAVDFGGGPLPATYKWDVVVAKLGLVGSHNWSRRLGGLGQEWLRGLALDPDGDLLLVGRFDEQIQFADGGPEALSTGTGDYDAFLVRLSGASGEPLWGHGFGPATPQTAEDVAVGPDGEIVVVGDFRGSIDLAGTVLPAVGGGAQNDIFVARFDEAGAHQWSQAYGDGYDDFAQAVDVDSDGNVVIAGYFYGSIDFGDGPLLSEASPAAFVAKLAPDGTPLWRLATTGQGAQVARAMAMDGDSIVVAGSFNQELQIGTETYETTTETLWVAKLDHDGAVQWGASFPGATDESEPGPVVALDSEGNILLTGPLKGIGSFGGGLLTSETDANGDHTNDAFVAKLDSAGDHLWSRSYGGTDQDYGAGIAADPQDYVLVTGAFHGDVSFGGDLLKTTGESIFVLKLSP
ncbi:MAG: hypothetical protein JRI68_07890 [Deltaproteobacteria bacterium]|nr:hypothetical protein [Deltaproteobacteria bacterium]